MLNTRKPEAEEKVSKKLGRRVGRVAPISRWADLTGWSFGFGPFFPSALVHIPPIPMYLPLHLYLFSCLCTTLPTVDFHPPKHPEG
jgi:hypothetical protein